MADVSGILNKREAYYGSYSGTVTKYSGVMMSSRMDLVGAGRDLGKGNLTGAAEKVGLKPSAPAEQKTAKHQMTLQITPDKVLAKIDGKQLADCDYTVGIQGGGSPRLIAGNMTFSVIIQDATADGAKAQNVFVDLSSSIADGGDLTRN